MEGTGVLEAPSLLELAAQQAGPSGAGCPGQAQAVGCPPAPSPWGAGAALAPPLQSCEGNIMMCETPGCQGPASGPGFPFK